MMRRCIAYGHQPSQVCDLYLPAAWQSAAVILIHGGFWSLPHGRDQLAPLCEALAAEGLLVWNIGYRRLGETGVGWPEMLDDVDAAIAKLSMLDVVVARPIVDATLIGHSAGGHLALCSRIDASARKPLRLRGVVALAPITDLQGDFPLGKGRSAVDRLLAASGRQVDSPIAFAAPRLPVTVLHGNDDRAVPIEHSRRYVAKMRNCGMPVSLVELAAVDHMDLIAPGSNAFADLRACLRWAAEAREQEFR